MIRPRMSPAAKRAGRGIRPPAAKPLPEAGFILVEMLVGLTVLAIMAGLMATFAGQLRPLLSITASTRSKVEIDAVARYLESEIAGALPLAIAEDGSGRRAFLTGSTTELRFVTIARQGIHSSGLRETSIQLREEGGRRNLVQSFRPRRYRAEEHPHTALDVTLLADVMLWSIAYLGNDAETGRLEWSDNWARDSLPYAVRVELGHRSAGREFTASADIALKLADLWKQPGPGDQR